ncbi:MAG: hypothetical protein HQM08_21960 [Candidatus Riflebacteria bacterium]|nr:hypothetical protein [Candidatus Riflebacteria bacterium]
MVLVLSTLLVLQGCGSSSDSTVSTVGATTTPTSQTVAAEAVNQAGVSYQIANVTTDAALAMVSNFSSLGSLPLSSVRYSVSVPSLPSVPPTIPSGNPTLATTTVLGTPPNTATIDWYVYIPTLDLTKSWAEWKTTITKSSVPIFTSYWQMAAPIANSDTSQTRGFNGSGWNNSNSLVVYTIGTGTYQTNGAATASGTQVANIKIGGVATQTAYSFIVTRDVSGSVSGSLSFDA